VDCSDSEDKENMIGLTEWFKGKKIVSCHFGKRNQKYLALYHTICRGAQEDEVLQVAQCNVARQQ
jgi:hypothetical protein